MKRTHVRIAVCAGFTALLLLPSSSLAQVAPSLGSADPFAVVGASAVTNTGPSTLRGNLGINPNGLSSITGFPPGTVFGTTLAAGAALPAQNSITTAFNDLSSPVVNPCTADLTGQDLGGMTLTPGVYCFSTSAGLTGTLTLDGQNLANPVFIFRIGSTLTTASGSSVVMINGSSLCNVFWRVGSSATLGTTTSFIGNILAQASITLTSGATVQGRALARTGAVTLDSNTVDVSVCGVPVPPTPIPVPVPVPTLPGWGIIALMALLSLAGFAAMRRRAM